MGCVLALCHQYYNMQEVSTLQCLNSYIRFSVIKYPYGCNNTYDFLNVTKYALSCDALCDIICKHANKW